MDLKQHLAEDHPDDSPTVHGVPADEKSRHDWYHHSYALDHTHNRIKALFHDRRGG